MTRRSLKAKEGLKTLFYKRWLFQPDVSIIFPLCPCAFVSLCYAFVFLLTADR